MPNSAPRRCLRCRQLVTGRRCPNCDKAWTRKPKSWRRGAGDRRWRRVRELRLEFEPLCQECGDIADTVDHLDGTDYDDDSAWGQSWLNIDMTRSLCTPCHRTRTAQQGNAARKAPS